MSMSVLMWVCVGEKEKVVVDYQKARLKNSSPQSPNPSLLSD
jgi:hypothetical protein